MNSRSEEKIANFSSEALNKLVFALLKQIELVKVITTEENAPASPTFLG